MKQCAARAAPAAPLFLREMALSTRPWRSNSICAAFNCSLFLPKNRRARASSFWRKTVFSRRDSSKRLAQGGHLLLQQVDLRLQFRQIHRLSIRRLRRPGCSIFFAILWKKLFLCFTRRSHTRPGAPRPSNPPRPATTARPAGPDGFWPRARPRSAASETCPPPAAWTGRRRPCRQNKES